MHCEARRIRLHTFNSSGAFVGEARRISLRTFNYAGACVGEARRICLHTFDYADAFVGICIVGPGEFVYICLIMLVHLLGYAL
jgi:hypothetical protein